MLFIYFYLKNRETCCCRAKSGERQHSLCSLSHWISRDWNWSRYDPAGSILVRLYFSYDSVNCDGNDITGSSVSSDLGIKSWHHDHRNVILKDINEKFGRSSDLSYLIFRLAALATEGPNLRLSIQLALCHMLFNLTGILLFYPIPYMRYTHKQYLKWRSSSVCSQILIKPVSIDRKFD